MQKRRQYLDRIIHLANKFVLDVESYNKAGLFDINKLSESFYIPLLNILFEVNLTRLETIKRDFPAIDLGDYGNRIAFQVTSEKAISKIISTLQTFSDWKLMEDFDSLYILIIKKKGLRYDSKRLELFNAGDFNFSSENILDKDDLIARITSIGNLDKLRQVYELYEFEFGDNKRTVQVLDFSSKEAFRKSFKAILDDATSIYYNELKEHWNSNSIIDNSPFLENLMITNVSTAIEFGLLPIISEYAVKHLHYDNNFKYIYNQTHVNSNFNEEEGYDLHVIYHIQFIGILYASAIWNKIDIGRFQNGYTHMRTIFSGMINAMLENMNVDPMNWEKEYPSNYHWLIGEIFTIMDNWLETFGSKEPYYRGENLKEYPLFSTDCSYFDFIPACIGGCLRELYKGFDLNKISSLFIARQIYYHVLSYYFSWQAQEELITEIENVIIREIPLPLMDSVLSLALDERFAIGLRDFKNKQFFGAIDEEKNVVERFWNFLHLHNLI